MQNFKSGCSISPLSLLTGQRSTVGNISDCRSKGLGFIPARSHNFVENDQGIIPTVILLPSADSRRVVVSYNQKYSRTLFARTRLSRTPVIARTRLSVPAISLYI